MKQEMMGVPVASAEQDNMAYANHISGHQSRQTTMPAPRHSMFYGPNALSDAQPTVSKHWRYAYIKCISFMLLIIPRGMVEVGIG